MHNNDCKISPLTEAQFPQVINYFLEGDKDYLEGLGADISKLPSYEDWYAYLLSELNKPIKEKQYYGLGWYYQDQLIGHSCIDSIEFGQQAKFHIHIWEPELRKQQLGETLLSLSLADYFEQFELQKIIGEPRAENTAPNKLLQKLGFKQIKTYETIPHPICVKQFVTRYELERPAEH